MNLQNKTILFSTSMRNNQINQINKIEKYNMSNLIV